MADVAQLALEVNSDQVVVAKQALDNLVSSGQLAEGAAARLESAWGSLGGAFGQLQGILATIGVSLGVSAIIADIGAAETAFAQLEAGVRSTGGAAGYTSGQLADMAHGFSETSAVSTTLIERAESLLLMFGRIGHDALPQAVQASLDLAAKMGIDLPSAAERLARAMENPQAGLTALSRAGVVFTQGQIEAIKQMDAAGEHGRAMALMFSLIEEKTGGAAAAFADTMPGALGKLRNAVDDAATELGKGGVSDAIEKMALSIQKFVDKNPDAMYSAGQHIADAMNLIAKAVHLVVTGIGDAVGALDSFGLAASRAGAAVFHGLSYLAPGNLVNEAMGNPVRQVTGGTVQNNTGEPSLGSTSIQAAAGGGGDGSGGGAVLTLAQQKQLAGFQDQIKVLKEQNDLLAQTDTLQRGVALSTTDAGRAINIEAEYLKLLASSGVPAIAETAKAMQTLKDRQTDLVAAGKLVEAVSDPYQKLAVQLAEFTRLEREGALSAQEAARVRVAAIDSVTKAQTSQLQGLLDQTKLNDLKAQQTISPGGGATADQVAQMQALNIQQQQQNYLLNEGKTNGTDYNSMRLQAIDYTQQLKDLDTEQTHAVDLFNQALSPMQKYQQAIAGIETAAKAFPEILTPNVVAQLETQAKDSADGITPAFKEMRDAVTSVGNALDSTFSKAIQGGQSFKQILAGLLQDLEKIALQSLVEKPLQDDLKRGVTSATTPISAGGSVDPNSWIGKLESFFGWLAPAGTALDTGATTLNTGAQSLLQAVTMWIDYMQSIGISGAGGLGAGGSFLGSAGTFGAPDFSNFLNGGSGLDGSSMGDVINGMAGGFPLFGAGDVFHRPTLGVLGDAGPEAAMPLVRGPGGSLGVAAHGSGGGASRISVVVNDHSSNGGNQVQASQSTDPSGQQQLEIILMDKIAKDITQGGRVGRSIDTRYGIARKPMGRS